MTPITGPELNRTCHYIHKPLAVPVAEQFQMYQPPPSATCILMTSTGGITIHPPVGSESIRPPNRATPLLHDLDSLGCTLPVWLDPTSSRRHKRWHSKRDPQPIHVHMQQAWSIANAGEQCHQWGPAVIQPSNHVALQPHDLTALVVRDLTWWGPTPSRET